MSERDNRTGTFVRSGRLVPCPGSTNTATRAASTAPHTPTRTCSSLCAPSVTGGDSSSPPPAPTCRVRPEPTTWSAIEYAAHSRDVTALHVYGVEQALTEDEPRYPPISDDVLNHAVSAYGEAEPNDVADELTEAACRLAQLADSAGAGTWTRGLTVGETRSDVRRLLEHALHDSQHHLDDVERGLTTLSG